MPLDNSIDGAGATPGSYTIIGQRPTTIVPPIGDAIQGMEIQASEDIYAVPFQIDVPLSVWQAAGQTAAAGAGGAGTSDALSVLVSEYAAMIQVLGELAPVVDITWQPALSRKGLVVGQLVVTVATPDDTMEAEIVVPFDITQVNQANNAVLAGYANLLKVAGLT